MPSPAWQTTSWRPVSTRRPLPSGCWRLSRSCGRARRVGAPWHEGLPIAQRPGAKRGRSEEHTSELQSHSDLVCRLLLEKKKNNATAISYLTVVRTYNMLEQN